MDQNKETNKLKKQIIDKAKKLDVDIIGFASADRWETFNEIPKAYHPRSLFPFTQTVIVVGLQIMIPILDTTPSIVYTELYNTTNRLLDNISYQIAAFLNKKGHQAVFFPRDAYGDISVLVEKPEAAFSHVIAGKYAGLGTIGYNHTLLTPEFGPRVRLVSVLTDAILEPDPLPEKEICIKCELCKKCCPTNAFTTTENLIADMDKYKCAEYHKSLKANFRYPCGVCIKVCPIGKDRKKYGMSTKKYLNERKVLKEDPLHPEYAGWTHVRDFGSKGFPDAEKIIVTGKEQSECKGQGL